MARQFGTLDADLIIGTAGDDRLSGGPRGNEAADTGDDTIIGGQGGRDVVFGWGGNDLLLGGTDDSFDVFWGGDGDDRIEFGGAGNALGEAGDDTVIAAAPAGGSAVLLNGGSGDDLLRQTGDGRAILLGDVGADTLVGGAGDDNFGLDRFGPSREADVVRARGGDDTISSDGFGDAIDGGPGFDLLLIAFGEGTEAVRFRPSPLGSATIIGGGSVRNAEEFSIQATDGDDLVVGIGGDDFLRGGGGADLLAGGRGDDAIFGGSGDDTIRGDTGADRLRGESGADAFRWRTLEMSGVDVIEDFEQGVDILQFRAAALGLALPAGPLDSSWFAVGSAVGDAAQFVYDPVDGILSWDADGDGGARGIRIVEVGNVDAADIVILP